MTVRDESVAAKFLAWGGASVTLCVTTWWTLEPVNQSKLLVLTTIAGVLIFLAASTLKVQNLKSSKALLVILFLFNFSLWLSVVTSKDSSVIGIFGATGRNTGALTYTSLSIVLFSAFSLNRINSTKKIIYGLLFAGFINLSYCLSEITGHEIFSWSNPYNTILGTLGNPDFISSFLGIFVVALIAYFMKEPLSILQRVAIFLSVLLGLFEIKKSHAIQGFVVFGIGISVIGFFYLRDKYQGWKVPIIYLIGFGTLGFFSVLGTLQIGPLQHLLYKTSVSLRGQYWLAGLNMGREHLLTGVGIDSYGSYFRRARSPQFAQSSPNTITDAAHNVFLDIFAGGGIFLLVSYIAILVFAIRAIYKVMARRREYDAVFVTLTAAWSSYIAQSIISINQIGLAYWGWVLAGALIGYERIQATGINVEIKNIAVQNSKKSRVQEKELVSAKSFMVCLVGFIVGAVVGAGPFMSDVKWRSALDRNDATRLQSAAFSWPQNPDRIYRTARILLNSKMDQKAYDSLIRGTQLFPESYVMWYGLFQFTPSDEAVKQDMLNNLRRIDPYDKSFN